MMLTKINRQCRTIKKKKKTLFEQFKDSKLVPELGSKPSLVELNCKINVIKLIKSDIGKTTDAYFESTIVKKNYLESRSFSKI